MSKSKVTIKEIAEMAGVSIATVSHVINRTRYVRPELVDKIEKIIVETGYQNKIADKERKLLVGRESTIVAVIPNIESTIYRDMVAYVEQLVSVQGYQFLVAITDNDFKEETQVLAGLLVNKKVAGIIHAPVSDVASNYTKLIQSGVPFVCVERNILGSGIDSVEFRDREAIFKGADYLLASGHKNVLFFRESTDSTTRDERTKGFLSALQKYNINTNDANIVDVTLENGEDDCMLVIQKALRRYRPTAVLAGGIDCPGEISVVGFGDESWSELTYPPLTIIRRDVKGLSTKAVGMLFEKINTGSVISHDCYADVELVVRKSTKMLDNGPFGDKAAAPDSVVLTKEEKQRLKAGHFRVAISFHYTGTSWAELHEKGICEELEQFGIDVVSVMDAHFDSELQNAQLDGIRLQKPDAVIAIPADDSRTREKFQELSKVSKLVFISNVPEGMSKNSYVSCVSVNESENGTNTGRMLGEYCKENKKKKAGFIIHGAAFYGTRVRDNAAERIIKDSYPDIDIVTIRSFGEISNAYQVARDVITANPEIEAMYVSWDRPALLVIKALKELGREDVAVFTTDLDHGIARCMEEGIVKGLSTQRPYEQGRAAAAVVAKSLVSEEQLPKYVGVQPYQVEPKQLRLAWKEIFHESMPDRLG